MLLLVLQCFVLCSCVVMHGCGTDSPERYGMQNPMLGGGPLVKTFLMPSKWDD